MQAKYREKAIEIWSQTKDFIKLVFRRLRLVRLNRNFLVFLVFLAISICFWWLKTLRETTTYTQEFNVTISNLPNEIIVTSGKPDKVRVTLNCTGSDLLKYKMVNHSYTINLNYKTLEKTRSKLSMDNVTLRRLVSRELNNSLKIASIYPNQIEMTYAKGTYKRAPIIFKGQVKADKQHVLCGIELLTEVAKVYAPEDIYDNITCVYTEPLNLKNIQDTTVTRVALTSINNVKIVPDSIDVRICVDLYTEASIQSPILCANIPRNKVLRFFPSKADIKYRVSAKNDKEIKETDFVIFVDYNKIKKNDTFATLELGSHPDFVSNVRFNPEKVEFVIETIEEEN